MSKISKVLNAISGHAYIETPLQDYHAAKAVVNAMRCKLPATKLSRTREALNKYRVSAWHHESGGIVLRAAGNDVLILN